MNLPEKRTHCVSCRLSPTELAMLDRQREKFGRTRGAYLRDAWLRHVPTIVPQINREAWVVLARAASNLNQLARALNLDEQVRVTDIQTALDDFRAALLRGGHEG